MPKYYKREMPDLRGTGEKQYYYVMRSEGAMDTHEIVRRMRQTYRVMGEGELLGVVSSLISAVSEVLAEGYTVSLDGMGSFSLALGLDDYDSDTPEQHRGGEPNARRVRVRDVNFKAQRKWVNDIHARCARRLHRDAEGERRIHRPTTTREERIQLALGYIREHGFLRLRDYVEISGLSRTTASRELRELASDKRVPIASEGRMSHKVYVEVKAARN